MIKTNAMKGTGEMISRLTIGRSAIVLAFGPLVALAGGCADGSLPSGSEPPSAEAKQLYSTVKEMYSAVVAGDYKTAYSYRSTRCKTGLTESAFTVAAESLYSWRNLAGMKEAFTVEVVEAHSTQAEVQVVFLDTPGSYNDNKAPRSWVKESGQWRFDECS